MRHQWTSVGPGLDKCACGMYRHRHRRRFPTYTMGPEGTEYLNAAPCTRPVEPSGGGQVGSGEQLPAELADGEQKQKQTTFGW